MNYVSKTTSTLIGELTLIATDKGLAALLWENDQPNRVKLGPLTKSENHPILLQAERELREYLLGQRHDFSVPLAPHGTPFQHQVWNALRTIPFGETRSYAQLAHQIGHPKATRAVGAANGRNPISIIVPCHRVIGSSGQLIGFTGGLQTKRHLLALESAHRATTTTHNNSYVVLAD